MSYIEIMCFVNWRFRSFVQYMSFNSIRVIYYSVLTVVCVVTYVFLYMFLIHVKGMKTKKNNDKINEKKKNMKRIIKSDPPPPLPRKKNELKKSSQ